MDPDANQTTSARGLPSLSPVDSSAREGSSVCSNYCITGDGNDSVELTPVPEKVKSTPEQPMEKPRPSVLQIMLVLFGSLGHFAMGLSVAWPNVLASSLAVENSTLASEVAGNMEKMDLVGTTQSRNGHRGLVTQEE
ncbi:uncharacterized protein LOC126991119 [Eriocheir sinensis]|uniref:uncharacterized protein LOC126991119 n=1 Tax=Eriocheir sinensis TaxID=95602 RepID=UPI0021C69678|nr:uncharacterized protein LOC126991119 [Eriocheir sinensis]